MAMIVHGPGLFYLSLASLRMAEGKDDMSVYPPTPLAAGPREKGGPRLEVLDPHGEDDRRGSLRFVTDRPPQRP